MNDKWQVIHQLTNIENAAYLGIVSGVLTALTAGMLRLELTNSETETEALERARVFVDSINE